MHLQFSGDEKKKRSLSEIMFFGIGSSYITGLAAGGLWGLIEHTRTFDASSQLLRRNHCLNSITKRGTFVGNSLGVLALFYTASAGCIGKLRDKDDLWNDIGAGAVTGGLYKSTKGIATFSKFVGIGAIGGLLLNLANGTFEEGTSYASDTISETYEDLFERR